jgi:hypothetical protein
MLSDDFRKQRAQTVRDLADQANDPFIKKRLLNLVARYEGDGIKAPTPMTPLDLEFQPRGTGSERG